VRSYESSLRLRVLPELGARRLTDVERADLQALVDRMVVDGDGASTVRNALLPVRAIYRRALVRGDVAVNPTTGLELPAVRGTRGSRRPTRPSSSSQRLIATARCGRTAMFAGLRRGELRALTWDAVDFDCGVIRVAASWDRKAGPVAPKSRAGRRTVPMASALRVHLAEHRLQTGRADGLVFGRTADDPFDPSTVVDRARKAWAKVGMPSIGLHECRHTFASLMIVAGVNAKALATYMGHASVTITFDLYGPLMPGNEQEAAGRLDALLDGARG
jgi:integrase